jgi:hypothetical protein
MDELKAITNLLKRYGAPSTKQVKSHIAVLALSGEYVLEDIVELIGQVLRHGHLEGDKKVMPALSTMSLKSSFSPFLERKVPPTH